MLATTTASGLAVAGLTPLSTCDWPGQLVATVFLQGCPLACTYCHNPSLIDPRVPGTVEWEEVVDLLRRRRGLLDGVVFSGGEPTRQHGLRAAMLEVRELGYRVGLHTAGVYPNRLEQVLDLVDWVGLDIKSVPRLYAAQTGVDAWAKALASLRLVQGAGVSVQVRTTVDPTIQAADDVTELTELLAGLGVDEHVLQEVRPDGTTSAYREALLSRARD